MKKNISNMLTPVILVCAGTWLINEGILRMQDIILINHGLIIVPKDEYMRLKNK